MNLMTAPDLVLTIVFLVLGIWFLIRNRMQLSRGAIARHIVCITLVWAGSMAFSHGDVIVRWVFGREIYKGDPKETAAVLVRLGGPLLFFAGAAIALGKDRVRQFKLYGETFGVKKSSPPK